MIRAIENLLFYLLSLIFSNKFTIIYIIMTKYHWKRLLIWFGNILSITYDVFASFYYLVL